ncbi:MAG TPA: AAA family ATPase [Acidimicrobiales bacterium]|jgi:putative DNA primase/helicase
MTEYQAGERLAFDETAEPAITWLAYSTEGQIWAACYIDGALLHHGQYGRRRGWYRHDAANRRVAVADKTIDRARAIRPDEPPLWPPQEELRGQPGSDEPLNGPRLTHRLASMVTAVPPVWLWERWLVSAAVQLLVARQGTGKSTFAAWVVANLSTGRAWPDDNEDRSPLRCGMLSLEEPAERLVARLVAAGADLDAVEILGPVIDRDDDGRLYQRSWQLPGDCGALETAITGLGLAVVTIDGLGYSVRGDSHNYAVVGSALSALAGVAERTGAAIVGLTHPPKGNSDAVTAAIGSTAWTAVARVTWVMGADPTDESGGRRVVRPAPGSNYRLPDHGLSFAIGNHDETEAGFVTAITASDVDPQTITSPPVPESAEERTALDEAVDWLGSYLGMGAMKAQEVKTAAHRAGIAERTLERARRPAGVETRRDGFGPGTVYWWSLAQPCSPCTPTTTHGRQTPDAGEHGDHVANMAHTEGDR